MERETGVEPATCTLARCRSTTEPLPHNHDTDYSTVYFRLQIGRVDRINGTRTTRTNADKHDPRPRTYAYVRVQSHFGRLWRLPALALPCYNNAIYTAFANGEARVCRQAAPTLETPRHRLK